jgi:apolipoprotein N-acyltransferase
VPFNLASPLLGALILGVLHGLSFAPAPLPAWMLPLLQLVSFGALTLLVWHAATLRRAIWTGALFGLGNFAVGISWIYISLHVYAFMAAGLAAAGVGLLAAYLSLYPAFAAGLAWYLSHRRPALAPAAPLAAGAEPPAPPRAALYDPSIPAVRPPRMCAPICALAMAASWAAGEWLRGVLFTGFPWLNIGYGHVDGPLHGWAPVLGVYGVAFMAALTAASLALVARRLWCERQGGVAAALRASWPTLAMGLAAPVLGSLLALIGWVQPYGPPLTVRLVQANIPLSEKFDPALIWQGMDMHRKLAEQPRADGKPIALTILPETAVPVFQDQLSTEAWKEWVDSAAVHGGTFALGVAMRDIRADRDYYYNSVITLDGHSSPDLLVSGHEGQRYDKRHLVPFGEFVPPGFHWFVDEMAMPLGDFDRGPARQQPFAIGGQRIAMNICYEDVFGEELLAAVRPGPSDAGATILANVSNLAWFGNSLALPQQLQMSRMRVRETGRPMLRATNTGITAAVDAGAAVIDKLPPQTAGALDVVVRGTTGLTPYVRLGNLPILILVIGILAFLIRVKLRAS